MMTLKHYQMTNQLLFYEAFKANKGRDMDSMLFLQGQQDCKEGKPHASGRGESYDRGYATQYEWEQVQEAMSRG